MKDGVVVVDAKMRKRVVLSENSKLRHAWAFKNHGGFLLPSAPEESDSKPNNTSNCNNELWRLSQSQHMCCIFENEDECMELMKSFLLGGILTNEKMLYLVERADLIEKSLDSLKDEVFFETEQDETGSKMVFKRSIYDFYGRGQIVFLLHSESYIKNNVFDCERSINQIKEFRLNALKEGYKGSRVTGCPSFSKHMEAYCPGTVDQLIEYEAKLNYFFAEQNDCHAWCQYNKTLFSHSTLLSILTTHPTAVICNEIFDNFYYIPPDELLDKANVQQATLNNWVSNLRVKKTIDTELRETNGELMKVNQALTGETTKRRQVEREKAEADALNRVKSQFMATISHEIRTPLTGILGTSSELMQSKNLTKEQQESIAIIHSSGDHLLSVLNEILTFSSLESGKFSLDVISFDLRECIKNVLDMFRLVAKQREMTVECDTNSEIPRYIKGDPTRLRQVLFNLISNAIKFTPNKGRVTVVINSTRLNEPTKAGNHVNIQFAVIDTGIGISREKFDLIFDSFSQIDSSLERQYEGTGLGLSISKKIVEAWNGVIWVTSEGVGSKFYFTLPTEVVSELPKRQNQISSSLDQIEVASPLLRNAGLCDSPMQLHCLSRSLTGTKLEDERSGTNKRSRTNLSIMIADDNGTNKKVLSKMLDCVGYPPEIVVSTGQEVVDEVQRRRKENTKQLDVILLDLQTTKLNGLEASRAISKFDWRQQRKPIVICLASASAQLEGQDQWKAEGMEYHLTKPIRMETLESLLNNISSNRWL